MADSPSGGLSGVLFEAGKTLSDAGTQQAQQTAQSVFSSVTGSQKPLFSKPQSSSSTPKSTGQQLPKLDPLGDFGKMFESGKVPQMGGKNPLSSSAPQFSQADLVTMAAENQAKDAEEIAKREAELAQIKAQAHKARHDEVYYNAIQNAGKSMAEERQERQQAAQQAEAENQQEQAQQQLGALPNSPLDGSMQGLQPLDNPQITKKGTGEALTTSG